MVKRALITGITGQDASYLSEYLCDAGYEVHGTIRRVSTLNNRLWRIEDPSRIQFHQATLESEASLSEVVRTVNPHECYHLAAQSDVTNSFQDEFSTMQMNASGTHYLLSAIARYSPECRFYFAGSSEMFGGIGVQIQDEETPFHPRSPYAISKVCGFNLTQHYREAHGLFACCGILFNHESPRRGEEFVTRKIAMAVARIKNGDPHPLVLGNITPERDWGYAPEYVRAMHVMLNQQNPDDYVIATNETHSVEEFCEEAFRHAGIDWREHVQFSKSLERPCEVMRLRGDFSKAKSAFGWEPKVRFQELVRIMVDAELSKKR